MDSLNIDAVATLKRLNVLIEKMEWPGLVMKGEIGAARRSAGPCFVPPLLLHLCTASSVSVSSTAAAPPQMVLGPDGNCSVLPVDRVLASVLKELNTFLHSRKCAQMDFYQFVIRHEP